MTLARFEITNCTAAGEVEVVGEQGTLWKGTWPRVQPTPRPLLTVLPGGYLCELHQGTGPYGPLRIIEGGNP